MTGFEPATSCSQSKHSTKLSYTPFPLPQTLREDEPSFKRQGETFLQGTSGNRVMED